MKAKPPTQDEVLVIVPTLRERDNITVLQKSLEVLPLTCRLLVIDDASDDGTQLALRDLMRGGARVTLFARPGALGLGSAYTLALSWARGCGFRRIVQMDADLSHDPRKLGDLVEALNEADVAIGSRYVCGGSTADWSRRRYGLSRIANGLARLAVNRPIQDVTSGFRAVHGPLLDRVSLASLRCRHFGWQWEFTRLALRRGAQIREVPIRFHQRASGKSKLSVAVTLESLRRLIELTVFDCSGKPESKETVSRSPLQGAKP